MPENWKKDFMALVKNVASLSHGEIVVQQDKMEDDLSTIYITLMPKDGPYKHGHFEFEITDYSSYPDGCPNVQSETKIYHPNIEDGAVCFSMFDDWSSSYDLIDLAMGLLYLLKNPEVSDPLNSEFEGWESEEEFLEKVKKTLKGQVLGYTRNWHSIEGEDSEDESTDTEQDTNDTEDTPLTDPPQLDKIISLPPDSPLLSLAAASNLPVSPSSALTLYTTFAIGAALVFTIVIYKMIK